MFSAYEARKLVIADWENKKVFECKYTFKCVTCKQGVYVGDFFIFVGEHNKMCISCKMETQEMIQERL